MFCLKISDGYFIQNNSYGSLKNGILKNKNVIFTSMRLIISVTAMKPRVREKKLALVQKIGLLHFHVDTNAMQVLWVGYGAFKGMPQNRNRCM